MPLDGSIYVTKPDVLSETQKVLLRAAVIVRERWCQNDYGHKGLPRCAFGAIAEAGIERGATMAINGAIVAMRTQVGEAVHTWNDTPGRTAEQVAQALESAALSRCNEYLQGRDE